MQLYAMWILLQLKAANAYSLGYTISVETVIGLYHTYESALGDIYSFEHSVITESASLISTLKVIIWKCFIVIS